MWKSCMDGACASLCLFGSCLLYMFLAGVELAVFLCILTRCVTIRTPGAGSEVAPRVPPLRFDRTRPISDQMSDLFFQ